jgi:hypothetical protein
VRPAVRLGLLFWSQDSSASPFAKSSVRFRRMTHAGSTKLFRNKRLKSCLGRGEVYRPFRALHAQLAKLRDQLFWTVPAAETARDGLKGRYGHAPTAKAASVWQRVCRDVQAKRSAGPTEAELSVTLHPLSSDLRWRTFTRHTDPKLG